MPGEFVPGDVGRRTMASGFSTLSPSVSSTSREEPGLEQVDWGRVQERGLGWSQRLGARGVILAAGATGG